MSHSPENLPTLMLVERAQDDDFAAMQQLFERFLPRVRRIAAVRLGRNGRAMQEVDDLVQEALFDAFRGLENFDTRSDGQLLGWLSKIVENRLRAMLRHGRAQKRGGDQVQRFADFSQACGPSRFADLGASPSQNAMGAELETRVSEKVHELPEQQRELVILRLYCQLSYEEIAAELQLGGADSARALFSRALRTLGSMVLPGQSD